MENDISTLITETINSIQAGIPEGYEMTEDIQFEIQIVTNKTSKGGMDIKLLNAGSEKQENLTHKIKFAVSPEEDKEQKQADILEGIEKFILGAAETYDNVKDLLKSPEKKQIG